MPPALPWQSVDSNRQDEHESVQNVARTFLGWYKVKMARECFVYCVDGLVSSLARWLSFVASWRTFLARLPSFLVRMLFSCSPAFFFLDCFVLLLTHFLSPLLSFAYVYSRRWMWLCSPLPHQTILRNHLSCVILLFYLRYLNISAYTCLCPCAFTIYSLLSRTNMYITKFTLPCYKKKTMFLCFCF